MERIRQAKHAPNALIGNRLETHDIDPKYTRFTPEGDEALAIVARLAEAIADAWETLKRNVFQGMSFGAASILFIQAIRDLLRAAYSEVWVIGRGDAFGGEVELTNAEAAVEQDVSKMEDFLETVSAEVEPFTESLDKDGALSLLSRRLSRIVFFAGGAWTLFNLAKVYNAEGRSLWAWAGPVDENSCTVCREEMAAGPRPLGDISRYPGRDTICLDNCRHELVRVG